MNGGRKKECRGKETTRASCGTPIGYFVQMLPSMKERIPEKGFTLVETLTKCKMRGWGGERHIQCFCCSE